MCTADNPWSTLPGGALVLRSQSGKIHAEVQMTSKSFWKLVPLAVFLALGLLALTPGGTTRPTNVSADNCGSDNGTLRIQFVEDGSEVTFEGFSVTITPDPTSTAHDSSLTIDDEDNDDDASGNIGRIEVDNACRTNHSGFPGGGYDFEADVVNNSDADDEGCVVVDDLVEGETWTSGSTHTVEIEVNCTGGGTAEGNVIIIKDASGATSSEDFDFEISGTSNECDDTFTLGDNDEVGYDCDENGTYTVTETALSGWTLTAINCDDVGISSGDIEIDLTNRKVTFDIGTGDSIECTFKNTKSGTATPTATSTPGVPGSVTVQAVPNAVNCNGSSFITVVVRTSAGGQPVDGALVNISTTLGTVSPGQATTSNGSILTIFTAPSTSGGTATITASASGVSGTATIQVQCAAATAVPPTPIPQQPAPTGAIRPPSTGDAGLLTTDGHGFAWDVATAATVIAASFVGAFALIRRRAQG